MVSLGGDEPPEIITPVPSLEFSYEEIGEGELIGQGGNADVYRVSIAQEAQKVSVAVKQPRMTGTLHSDTVERFIGEAEVWDQLDDHNHVVSLLDWDTDPVPWLAMEYMDGGTLESLLAEGQLPLNQAIWVGLCICRAVRHAHRHGVAHHDLKPANVLFTDAGEGWMVPKVSDWGLARLMLEETGSTDGLSPHYAAPEQFDADQYGSPDDRTDIYQVGALLYELVTGQPPFEGSATAVMQGTLFEELTPPSEIADVPSTLDDIILPALQKEPSERYDSVVYLRDELEDFFDTLQERNESKISPADPSKTDTNQDTTARSKANQHEETRIEETETDQTITEEKSEPESSEKSATTQSPHTEKTSDPSTQTAKTDSHNGHTQIPKNEQISDDTNQNDHSGALTFVSRFQNKRYAGIAGILVLVVLLTGLVFAGGAPFGPPAETQDTAGLEVTAIDTPNSITPNERFTVSVEVSNTGPTEITDTIVVESTPLNNSKKVTLPPGETGVVEFTGEAEISGNHTIVVNSSISQSERPLMVEQPRDFIIKNISLPDFANASERFTATVTVRNPADTVQTRDISINSARTNATKKSQITVDPNQTKTVEFEFKFEDAGEYQIEASVVGNSGPETTVADSLQIKETANFRIENVEVSTEGVEDEMSIFTINSTITNSGAVGGTRPIEVRKNGLPLEQKEVTLAPGETQTIEFRAAIDEETEVTINSGSDEETVVVSPVEGAFSISNLEIKDTETDGVPVRAGNTLRVTAEITNEGPEAGEQEITVTAGDLGTQTSQLELAAGDTANVSFELETNDGSVGEKSIIVNSEDDEVEDTVRIRSPALFDVAIDEAQSNLNLTQGENAQIAVAVTNEGGIQGAREIEVHVEAGSLSTVETQQAQLESGESQVLTFEFGYSQAGTYEFTVTSGDDTAEGKFEIAGEETSDDDEIPTNPGGDDERGGGGGGGAGGGGGGF